DSGFREGLRMAEIGATLPSVHQRSKDSSLHPLRPLADLIPKVSARAETTRREIDDGLAQCYVQRVRSDPMDCRRLSFSPRTTPGKGEVRGAATAAMRS